MPSKRFPLERGGDRRVGVDWTGVWKSFVVTLDGRLLGSFADGKALQRGGQFPLPDGSQLEVRLVQLWPLPELRLLRDGIPLPGSPSDPAQRVREAGQLICGLAGLSLVLGLFSAMSGFGAFARIGFGLASAVESAVALALGVVILRGSPLALCAATVLFVVGAC